MSDQSKEEVIGVLVPTDPEEQHIDEDQVPSICLFTRFFPGQDGKFFGRPAWLSPKFPDSIKAALTCAKCHEKPALAFIAQINTSVSDGFYRFVYLFMCVQCNGNYCTVRGWLPHRNPHYYLSELEATMCGVEQAQLNAAIYRFEPDVQDAPPSNVMDIIAEDLTTDARDLMIRDPILNAEHICRICLVPTREDHVTEVVGKDHARAGLYEGDFVHSKCYRRLLITADLPTKKCSIVGEPMGVYFEEEMELLGRIRGQNIKPMEFQPLGIAEEKQLLAEENQALTAEQANELDTAMDPQETLEAEFKEAYDEELRLRDEDGLVPVMRYQPGSDKIYWMTSLGALEPTTPGGVYPATGWKGCIRTTEGNKIVEETVVIPSCPSCGADKQFVAQIYSSVCTYGKRELDIGTVAIFSCSKDCTPTLTDSEGGYCLETCYVQFDDTAVKHDIKPRLY